MSNAIRSIALLLVTSISACASEGHDPDEENEVISRVELSFVPVAGGDVLTFSFSDPDGDGGVSGTAEPIVLTGGTQYTLELRFLEDLVEPAEDITQDIRMEAEDHFVFVLGDVVGPAADSSTALLTHAYADLESDYGPNAVGDDLPVGLVNTISTNTEGTGTLRIMLRHLPQLNGNPQKTGDLPQVLANGESLPGNADADISFELVVQ
jgi:hypothetical protein